ncbi:uncharacterized protein DNG_03604 [Cephalotrichum gorgonifer]|uniref:Uncharacterized protein n=1 Tax=Cephalotrichum gorgonifer TaxID=2041049 RepID=A0AAE8MVL8_9PEZI|nr:uncharacterized protein DNG_03604 [Cephalotrichum gorgonifer]
MSNLAADEVLETIEYIQKALQPYLGSREHVDQIKRLLRLHLQETVDGQPGQPLSLLDGAFCVGVDDDSTGLELEYKEAVNRYASSFLEFQKVQSAQSTQTARPSIKTSSQQRLDDQTVAVGLRDKKDRLKALHRYIDAVAARATTGDAALDLNSALEGTKPLPEVPSKIVDSFASEGDANGAGLGSVTSQLNMILLKAKLLLQREAELLKRAKANSSVEPGSVSNGAKAKALDATRAELINWIEEELSKASGEDDLPAENGDPDDDSTKDAGVVLKEEQRQRQISKQLEKEILGIEAKYAQYVSSRKTLVETLGRSRSLLAKTMVDYPPSKEVEALLAQPQPTVHLQLPYLEGALKSWGEQKALISHKSFLNVSLGKQLKDSTLAIEHLAEESQLLPDYPMPNSQQSMTHNQNPLGAASSERPDLTGRVKPWAYASESSKIATFESITEKIEGAQMAMEDAITTLDKADKLLGKDTKSDSRVDENESDIWLEKENGSGNSGRSKHHSMKAKAAEADVFSTLKLDLGLLGREDRH